MKNQQLTGEVFINIASPVSEVFSYVVDLKLNFPKLFRGFGRMPGAVCIIPAWSSANKKSDLIRFSNGTILESSIEACIENSVFKLFLKGADNKQISSFISNAEITWFFENHNTHTKVTCEYQVNLKSSYFCRVATLLFMKSFNISLKEYLFRLKRYVEAKREFPDRVEASDRSVDYNKNTQLESEKELNAL
jgi:hypothetical protein